MYVFFFFSFLTYKFVFLTIRVTLKQVLINIGTDLKKILKGKGIKTVIITGTVTRGGPPSALLARACGLSHANPVRNSRGALNPTGIEVKCNPVMGGTAEQGTIISNGVKGQRRIYSRGRETT